MTTDDATYQAHVMDIGGRDLWPTCPACNDLAAPEDRWCQSCGVWLRLTPPLSSDLTSRRRQQLLAGPTPEAAPPSKEREDQP